MKAHVSGILLGVEDMDRSKRFYTEVSAGRLSRTTASRRSSSRTAARSSASTAATAWPPRWAPARRVAASARWSSTTWCAARRGSTRSSPTPRRPAPRSSSPPPPCPGVGTAVRSPTRMATSGALPTARRERTSPTRNSEQAGSILTAASPWRPALAASTPKFGTPSSPVSWRCTAAVPSTRRRRLSRRHRVAPPHDWQRCRALHTFGRVRWDAAPL
jgi:hypothetical protein